MPRIELVSLEAAGELRPVLDADFVELRRHFSDAQVVEIVAVILPHMAGRREGMRNNST